MSSRSAETGPSATSPAGPSASAPTVSVVVPAHRDGPELAACLAALAACVPAPDEVVVAVDGADPAVVARAQDAGARVVALAEQGGPAHARNAGAAVAVGDVLYFVDADVAVHPSVIAIVKGHFRDQPHVDAVIGSYDDEPPAPGALSRYKNLLNHFVHQRARTEATTFWGACGAIRRAVFLDAGGFDEQRYTRPQVEDIELGYRLADAGRRLTVRHDLLVTHLKRWTPVTLLRADILDRAVPWSELIVERGFDDDLNTTRAQRAKVALACVTALALVVAPASRRARRSALAGLVALGVLDASLLVFLARRGGLRVALVGAGWHWWSYLYSAAVFLFVAVRRAVSSRGGGR